MGSYLVILFLTMLLCRYLYSVLPPGDEDLKGTEVQAIIKFKSALGLDDVDAANMHMEVLPPDLSPMLLLFSSLFPTFSMFYANKVHFPL
jgi:hypothetical protein